MRVLPRVKRRWRWLAAFIFLLWLAVLAADRLWPLPLHDVTPARVVVAEDGTPLWRFADAQGVWRYPVTLADVSPRYLQALIQYEDRWFWKHPGVNPFAVLRAAWQDLTSGRVISGGSTLTMQVARLLDPHPRTFGGKLRQLWRALQLEWHLSKSEILTLYLNRAPFGGTLQGIGAASWAYLGKPPAQLSYGEAALLAVLPQRIYFQIMRYERVIFVILLAAVWAGVLDGVLGTFNDVVWDLLDLGTGYIDQIAYSAYYATIGTVI